MPAWASVLSVVVPSALVTRILKLENCASPASRLPLLLVSNTCCSACVSLVAVASQSVNTTSLRCVIWPSLPTSSTSTPSPAPAHAVRCWRPSPTMSKKLLDDASGVMLMPLLSRSRMTGAKPLLNPPLNEPELPESTGGLSATTILPPPSSLNTWLLVSFGLNNSDESCTKLPLGGTAPNPEPTPAMPAGVQPQ